MDGAGPLLLRDAERLADAPGMASAATIERVYFVSGRIMSTTSTIWKCPCLLVLMGFWPVIIEHRHRAELRVRGGGDEVRRARARASRGTRLRARSGGPTSRP